MPADILHIPSMARKTSLLRRRRKIPDLNRPVIRTTGKLGVIRGEGDAPNGLLMSSREDLETVHGGLPELDDAGVLTGDEEVAVVGPGHGADGGVVGLQDRLEVKGGAVPEGELACRGAGQDSSSIRCPLKI